MPPGCAGKAGDGAGNLLGNKPELMQQGHYGRGIGHVLFADKLKGEITELLAVPPDRKGTPLCPGPALQLNSIGSQRVESVRNRSRVAGE